MYIVFLKMVCVCHDCHYIYYNEGDFSGIIISWHALKKNHLCVRDTDLLHVDNESFSFYCFE